MAGCKRTWTDIQLLHAVNKSYSMRQTLIELGLAPEGGSYRTVQKYIKILGIDTSHWLGKSWSKGKKVTTNPGRSLEEYLVYNGPYIQSFKLKKRLIKAGCLRDKCIICNINQWLGKNISLELDHINGDPLDNRIENLRILCPNCHSQTDTFRAKKRSRKDIINLSQTA